MTDASGRWARRLVCSRTGVTAPLDEPAFLSPAGAPWLVEYELDRERGEDLRRSLAGRPWTLWRYRELLPVADFAGRVDLGEGATPLVRMRRFAPDGPELWLKDESLNPTGSFKARGLSLAVNRARELGADRAGAAVEIVLVVDGRGPEAVVAEEGKTAVQLRQVLEVEAVNVQGVLEPVVPGLVAVMLDLSVV